MLLACSINPDGVGPIEATDGVDWATQDLAIEILRDEERHCRLFEGFLREFEAGGTWRVS